MRKRIAIFVIAYDAVNTLAATIDRIPPEVMEKVEEIFIIDDCSNDNTYYAALGYKESRKLDKLQVFRNPVNLRYGGNQKVGYQYAIDRGFDIVVMLHADGQYAPEVLPRLLEPLENDETDMVFGSRMAEGGDPLRGGMPLYKFVGNKILTWIENHLLGMHLSEFHSGYRLYATHALKRIPFMANSNEWHFDTEILIQYKEAGLRIAERPVPTYYGDEICHVNGLAYAFNCVKSCFAYLAHKQNWIHLPKYDIVPRPASSPKPDPHSRHAALLAIAEAEPARRVLLVGAAGGALAERLEAMGSKVVGVAPELVEQAAMSELGEFDMVLCLDVLEHLKDPQAVLTRLTEQLKPGGRVVISLPNIAMWLWRFRLLMGRFDPPEAPLRFFTLASGEQLIKRAGLALGETRPTPFPLPELSPSFGAGRRLAFLHGLNDLVTRWRPTLLAYHFIFQATKPTKPAVPPRGSGQLPLTVRERVVSAEPPIGAIEPAS